MSDGKNSFEILSAIIENVNVAERIAKNNMLSSSPSLS